MTEPDSAALPGNGAAATTASAAGPASEAPGAAAPVTVFPPASAADIEVVSEQLGRPARGVLGVGARCVCGNPVVVVTAPRLDDGTPFPTLYYLTHPAATAEMSRLEAAHLMVEMQEALAADADLQAQYLRAHEQYLAERERIAHVEEIAHVTAGGMPTRVKCLHALVGHALSAGPGVNPMGDWALRESRWSPERCACERPGAAAAAEPAPAPHDRVDPYVEDAPMWSGDPNGALVAEASALPPGRALDVGSGEGADAVWLASQGWDVTAVEPSPTAMRRAREAAEAAGAEVDWRCATLLEADLPREAFDLVTVCYPALFRTEGHDVERALLERLAPGGTLLVVTHAHVDRERALAHGFDPDAYLDHAAFRDALGEGWTVEVDEARERRISGGGGAHHHDDLILRARRA